MAAFDKAVMISATAGVWNAIAYDLALKKAHLDVARRYAESAVSATEALMRNVSLEQLSPRDLRSTSALGNYWDTLGWVEFADGNVDKALKYVAAAWQLNQAADEADHLGQIYAKKSDKEKATYFYAVALTAQRPEPETRGRLGELLGGDGKVDAVVEKYRNELQQLRTIRLATLKDAVSGSAEFFVLLDSTANARAAVDGVKFVSGDDGLKPAAEALRAATYDQSFPDGTPVKILRRGKMSCKSASACTFLMDLPEDVSAVD
jgi:tetratricopeptide (TPR) repeat protein